MAKIHQQKGINLNSKGFAMIPGQSDMLEPPREAGADVGVEYYLPV
jgi:hypothetical protein